MYNQKMENIELLNKVNFDAKEWASIVLGIRKSLNLSQTELATRLGFSRYTPMRYENCLKIPRKNSIKKVLKLIEENNLDIEKVKELGRNCVSGFAKDTKIPKLKLEYSKELAELIGILLGDGEIMKDGTLRISFDLKKDLNFHYRRTFPLIKNLLGNKLRYESYKRFVFYNTAFVRFLNQDCGLRSGNKSRNNWEIPKWCLEKNEYSIAVLRGLFDTDGYFGYWGGSLEIMYGRFSDRCIGLVNSIQYAFKMLNFNPVIKHTKDGRYRIRIQNKKEVIRFFSIIGTSNLKHIVRFLLWRINRYEARIEIEGLKSLVNRVNQLIKFDIGNVKLPFYWNSENKDFVDYIMVDDSMIKGAEFRNLFKWNLISKDLIEKVSDVEIAKELGITARSVRKWREGVRIPSGLLVHKLINIAEKNNIKLSDYRCN